MKPVESLQVLLVRHYYALLTRREIWAELIKSIKTEAVCVLQLRGKKTKNKRIRLSKLQADARLLFKMCLLFSWCNSVTRVLPDSQRVVKPNVYMFLRLGAACVSLAFFRLWPWRGNCEWQLNNGYSKNQQYPVVSLPNIITIVSGHFICSIQVRSWSPLHK